MSPLTGGPHVTLKRVLEVAAYPGGRLTKNPREVVDLLGMYLALMTDCSGPAHAPHRTVDWLAALAQIAGSQVRAIEVSEEAGLREVELQVVERAKSLRHGGPWIRSFDLDQLLGTFLYAVRRLLKPESVIETGVSYGVSTAFLLKALSVNGNEILHSVDVPSAGPHVYDHVGVLVPEELRARWQLHRGSSRRLLPRVLPKTLDLFVHDSLHTFRNMQFEFDHVWPHRKSGGILIADDVTRNDAFGELIGKSDVQSWRVVAESTKPVSFGFAVKSSGSFPVAAPSA